MIVLPRQARDKHRENSKKSTVILQCALGCGFGDHDINPRPVAWTAVLRSTDPGGSYTITVKAANKALVPRRLQRVTYGEVFFCSGARAEGARCCPFALAQQHFVAFVACCRSDLNGESEIETILPRQAPGKRRRNHVLLQRNLLLPATSYYLQASRIWRLRLSIPSPSLRWTVRWRRVAMTTSGSSSTAVSSKPRIQQQQRYSPLL